MNLQSEISSELWAAVRRSYESQAWSNAILDGIHFLSDSIRTKSGLQSDGAALAGQALGGKTPKLRLNRLQTETELNIQAGAEQLLRGFYQAIRNPRSHEKVDDSQADAEALLLFVNYFLKVIGHARSSFSMEECVRRILEENFVPQRRYADLLLAEVPARQRLQLVLLVFRQREETDARKIRQFFHAAIAVLAPDEVAELFEAISTDLREGSDDDGLLSVLQILDPKDWPRISEVARLRSENRLLKCVRDGRYNQATDRCNSAGAVATWSPAFWRHFILKEEFLRALGDLLGSSSLEAQDYAFKYLFRWIDSLAEEPTPRFEALVEKGLKAGDIRYRKALEASWLWNDEKWSSAVMGARDSFQETTPVLPDDDIPF